MSKQREALEAAREALVNIRGWLCDRERCGHFLPEEIRGECDPALALVTEALEGGGEDEPVLHGFGPGGICCQRAVEDRCAEHRDAG